MNESNARLTFADIAGIDNVKAEVTELVAFLRNPKRFMELGAISPSGVLLVGGPGTGVQQSHAGGQAVFKRHAAAHHIITKSAACVCA